MDANYKGDKTKKSNGGENEIWNNTQVCLFRDFEKKGCVRHLKLWTDLVACLANVKALATNLEEIKGWCE